jgi:hypothetical protein
MLTEINEGKKTKREEKRREERGERERKSRSNGWSSMVDVS